MNEQKEDIITDKYLKAWIEAEREAIIYEFQESGSLGWSAVRQNNEPLGDSEAPVPELIPPIKP